MDSVGQCGTVWDTREWLRLASTRDVWGCMLVVSAIGSYHLSAIISNAKS